LARDADRSAPRTKRSKFDEVPEWMALRNIAYGLAQHDFAD